MKETKEVRNPSLIENNDNINRLSNPRPLSTRQFAVDAVTAICCTGVIGISLKLAVFWNRVVFFPFLPNFFDSVFLAFAVVWLTAQAVKKRGF